MTSKDSLTAWPAPSISWSAWATRILTKFFVRSGLRSVTNGLLTIVEPDDTCRAMISACA